MRPDVEVGAAAPGSVVPPDAPRPAPLADVLTRVERTASGDPVTCLALVPGLERAAVEAGDDDLLLRAAYFASVAHNLLGDDTAALTSMERALRLARERGDRTWEARVLTGLAGTHRSFGDHETAIELLEETLTLRQEMGDDLGVATALGDLGQMFEQMGVFPDRTREMLHEARSLFAGLDDAAGQAACLLALTKLELTEAEARATSDGEIARGVAGAAAGMVADGVALARTTSDIRLLASCLVHEGRARLLAGDLAATGDLLDEAGTLLARASARPPVELVVVRARLDRARGRSEDAVTALTTALRATEDQLRTADRLQVLAELVDAYEARGDLATALLLHRDLLAATLQHREESAERRARALTEKRDLERARLEAEMERLRSEQLELANKVLAHDATHDGLTGVANRRAVDEELAERTARSDTGGPRLACVVADLDHFKAVNDEHSHMVGDEVLRQVAQILQTSVRDTDLVGRLGGEEFILLLVDPAPDDARVLTRVCERLRAAVEKHPWHSVAPGLRVTMSVGVARHRRGESAEDVLVRADGLMYVAKRSGRNRVVLDAAVSGNAVSGNDVSDAQPAVRGARRGR